MRKGRKPKPARIKELTGNPGKRKPKKGQPKPRRDLSPAPDWLDDLAKQEWNRIAPELYRLGLLTVADRAALEAYCKCYSRWRQAEAIAEQSKTMVFKTPSGYIQQIPHISVAQKYLTLLNSLASEFGFTPSSRERLTTGGKGVPVRDEDAEFFGDTPETITKERLSQIRPKAQA